MADVSTHFMISCSRISFCYAYVVCQLACHTLKKLIPAGSADFPDSISLKVS
jgi:hypothetical protein